MSRGHQRRLARKQGIEPALELLAATGQSSLDRSLCDPLHPSDLAHSSRCDRSGSSAVMPTHAPASRLAPAVADGKVWLVRKHEVEQRPVVTGTSGNEWAEIKSGLSREDVVVINPDDRLKPGREVTIRHKSGD